MKTINYILAFLQVSVIIFASYLYYAYTQDILVFDHQVLGIYEIAYCSIGVWALSIIGSWINMYSISKRFNRFRKESELYSTQIHEIMNFTNENEKYFYSVGIDLQYPVKIENVSEFYIKLIPFLHKCIESRDYRIRTNGDEVREYCNKLSDLKQYISSIDSKCLDLTEENTKLKEECLQKKNSKTSKASRRKIKK